MNHNRIIKSRGRLSPIQLADCLSSIFALELLRPSQSLYLTSPWISDIPLLDSDMGQFRYLILDPKERYARLSTIFNILAARGTHIYIRCRPNQNETEAFLKKLDMTIGSIHISKKQTLHEKGFIGEAFYLRGSMNFTYSGMYINDEHIDLTTNQITIDKARLDAELEWSQDRYA